MLRTFRSSQTRRRSSDGSSSSRWFPRLPMSRNIVARGPSRGKTVVGVKALFPEEVPQKQSVGGRINAQSTHLSRRKFMELSGLTAVGLTGGIPALAADDRPRMTPVLALTRCSASSSKATNASSRAKPLIRGVNQPTSLRLLRARRRSPSSSACADSRVSPEILFDQGVGDLFVVRVAGNVVNGAGPTIKGSIEYAVAELGVPLVMVLGHSSAARLRQRSNTSTTRTICRGDQRPGQQHQASRAQEQGPARRRARKRHQGERESVSGGSRSWSRSSPDRSNKAR